jgi:hypothetical protein
MRWCEYENERHMFHSFGLYGNEFSRSCAIIENAQGDIKMVDPMSVKFLFPWKNYDVPVKKDGKVQEEPAPKAAPSRRVIPRI